MERRSILPADSVFSVPPLAEQATATNRRQTAADAGCDLRAKRNQLRAVLKVLPTNLEVSARTKSEQSIEASKYFEGATLLAGLAGSISDGIANIADQTGLPRGGQAISLDWIRHTHFHRPPGLPTHQTGIIACMDADRCSLD